MTTVLASLAAWVGAGPASATNCSNGLAPDFALTQSVTTGTGTTSYDLTVTNYGTCAGTNVKIIVTLPAGSTFVSASGVSRSWSCSAASQVVTCTLQSNLDQTSTGGSSGAAGKAEVVVTATAVSGGSKTNPPDVGESAYVDDTPQLVNAPDDPDDQIFGGAINPKTGGQLTAPKNGFTPKSTTLTVPSGVAGTVGISQIVPDSNCTFDPANPTVCPPADVDVHAPTITNGYNTIVVVEPSVAVTLYFEEPNGLKTALAACKGKTASPPCLYSTKFDTTSNLWTVTIHDSDGTKYWI